MLLRRAAAAAAAAALAAGYEVEFSIPKLVGQSDGGAAHFWMPGGGVGFGDGKLALSVRKRGAGCTCAESPDSLTAAGPACAKPCSPSHQWYISTDGGDSFHLQEESDFCGHLSQVLSPEGGGVARRCPVVSQASINAATVVIPQRDWSVQAGGLFSSPTFASKEAPPLTLPLDGLKRDTRPDKVILGENVVDFDDKKLLFRAATFTWLSAGEGGAREDLSAVYKSVDGGDVWALTNSTPSVIGPNNLMVRSGDAGLMIYSGTEGTKFVSMTSNTLGRKWGKPKPTNFTRVPSLAATHYTTIMGVGARGPPRVMFFGAKKGQEKIVDLSQEHDSKLTDEKQQFGALHAKAAQAAIFDKCDVAPFPNDPEKGCMSTGSAPVIDLGRDADNQNVTKFLACYDKLGAGWGGPRAGREDQVWCVRFSVNEDKEVAAYLKKRKREEEKLKAEEEAREKAEKAREERRKRDQEKRRAKNRADRERRKIWARLDYEKAIAPAMAYQELDGEMIVVRDVMLEWEDIANEGVGLPGANYKPPEPEPEVAANATEPEDTAAGDKKAEEEKAEEEKAGKDADKEEGKEA